MGMFIGRGLSYRIDHVTKGPCVFHMRSRCLIYYLKLDESVAMHLRNLRTSRIDVYKIHSKISVTFSCDLISEPESGY